VAPPGRVQRQVTAAEAQPVTAIQPPFDLHPSALQSGANLFAPQAPAASVPGHGVIVGHGARFAHAENFLQPMGAIQGPVGMGSRCGLHRKRRCQKGQKVNSRKPLACSSVLICCGRISFTSRSCKVPNSRLMRPLACGECDAIHSIPSPAGARPNCVRAGSPRNCSCHCTGREVTNRLFLSVYKTSGRPWRSSQPPSVRRFSSVESCSTNRPTPGWWHHRSAR
jgi:hypothetical protein